MNDGYLWDRSGAPDPEVERLERVLTPLRYRHREPRPMRAGWAVAAVVIGVAEPDRGTAVDRFRELAPVPPEVTREGVVRREAKLLDLCWNALELENAGWWRGWERKWGE